MKKLKLKNIIISLLIIVLIVILILTMTKNKDKKLEDLTNKTLNEVKEYAKDNKLDLDIKYEYNKKIEKDKVISQSIDKDTIIKKDDKLTVVISKGKLDSKVYSEYKVNELGNVPIMMYHRIIDMKSSETKYTGGNVDVDGYNRTTEAFRSDLEFY